VVGGTSRMLEVDREDDNTVADDGDEQSSRNQQSVKFPRRLSRRVQLAAVFLDRTISDIHEEAVTRYLEQLQAERRARGLPPIPDPPD
jgi:hypothetical protein